MSDRQEGINDTAPRETLDTLKGPAVEEQMAAAIVAAIVAATKPLADRIATLEARRAMKYVGVWERGQAYGQQEVVTHSNSLWVATADTTEPPGVPDSGWTLCIKRPRDAKDLR